MKSKVCKVESRKYPFVVTSYVKTTDFVRRSGLCPSESDVEEGFGGQESMKISSQELYALNAMLCFRALRVLLMRLRNKMTECLFTFCERYGSI